MSIFPPHAAGQGGQIPGRGARLRDRLLTSTDTVFKLTSIPLVDITVNAINRSGVFRKALESTGYFTDAPVPGFYSRTLRKRVKPLIRDIQPTPVGATTGKVALYATCYGNYNSPDIGPTLSGCTSTIGIHIDLVPKRKMLWHAQAGTG